MLLEVTPPLLQAWLDQLGDRQAASLTEDRFPSLLDSFMPEGFGMYVHKGSEIVRDGDSDVRVNLTAQLQPSVFEPFERLGTTHTGPLQRSFSTRDRTAHHVVMRLPEGWTDQGRGRSVIVKSTSLYRNLGIESVSLQAVDTGIYAWAALINADLARSGRRGATVRRRSVA